MVDILVEGVGVQSYGVSAIMFSTATFKAYFSYHKLYGLLQLIIVFTFT